MEVDSELNSLLQHEGKRPTSIAPLPTQDDFGNFEYGVAEPDQIPNPTSKPNPELSEDDLA